MLHIEPDFVVKVCGVTEEADAQAALDAGANALGFNFYPKSSRFVPPEVARGIAASSSRDYLRVGVFVNATVSDLLRIGEEARLDVLQLHGDECEIPADVRFRIWRGVRGDRPAPQADSRIEAYLLDAPTPQFGGSGKTFEWGLAKGFPYRAVVAGGLDGSNVAAAIAALQPWGVDACSRIELRPGKKDIRRMSVFIEAALRGSEALRMQATSLI